MKLYTTQYLTTRQIMAVMNYELEVVDPRVEPWQIEGIRAGFIGRVSPASKARWEARIAEREARHAARIRAWVKQEIAERRAAIEAAWAKLAAIEASEEATQRDWEDARGHARYLEDTLENFIYQHGR